MLEKIDQECKNALQLLKNEINKNQDDLREEIRNTNDALKQELTQNLKDEITAEVGVELQQGIANLKQELKDNIFVEVGLNYDKA
jgi:excinuclease UvrABC nuclease subunit